MDDVPSAAESPLTTGEPPPSVILWLTKGLGQGGMEQLLLNHAGAADRSTFAYRAAYLVDRPHSVVEQLRGRDVPVRRLGPGGITNIRWIRDLLAEIDDNDVALVHVHSPLPGSIARVVLRATRRRVPVVVTEHNRWDRYERATRWVNRATFGLNARALAVSDDCRSTMPGRVRERVTVVEHGIDADRVAESLQRRDAIRAELGVGDDTIVVGTVANFRHQKNYPLLLATAKRVVDTHDNVVFVSVGQGPLEDEMRRLHGELQLGDSFRFLGFRADATDVMAAFDIFCLSSRHEGLPVALMEAMTLGRPVVATAVGGVPEMISDGSEGRVVRPDSEPALAGALEELIEDPAFREACGRQAHRTAALRFSAAAATAIVEDVYRSVLVLPPHSPTPDATRSE